MLIQHVLDIIGEPVFFSGRFIQKGSPFNFSQAGSVTAKAIKGLGHFPFGRRVEKMELFSCIDRPECDQLQAGGIKEYIGLTAVIDILQELRHQRDMLFISYLYGEIGRFSRNGPC